MKSKKIISILLSLGLVFSFAPASVLAQAAVQPPAAQAGQGLAWPRVFDAEGVTFSVYQPQIEKWDGSAVSARLAVMADTEGKQTFGVVWLQAFADVDKEARIVTFRDFKITQAKFPTEPAKESEYMAELTKKLPQTSREIALDHFESTVAVSESVEKQIAVEIKNDAPVIFYSNTPAILVPVDGEPVLKPIDIGAAERVFNTRALIVMMNGVFYLRVLGYWYQADALEGPWGPTVNPPAGLEEIRSKMAEEKVVDTLEPKEGEAPPSPIPTVYVSTKPAELVQTDGSAKYLPIENTGLLQVQNADHALFMDPDDNNNYLLVSGRWFKAPALEGPWSYVPGKDLPADFAKIPTDHPKASVLMSVPGTPQAKEAVIANTIPQTAAVKRSGPQLDVKYDGEPQYQPIESTSLQYAANTTVPVIRVTENAYYAVQNGVWFTSVSAAGPWFVADSIPDAIYTIPPSSPLYYVTYVRVYGSTPEVVYVGYTPGYLGTVVSPDHVVVYGTGYTYQPYVGAIYVGYPPSYGYNAAFEEGESTGFGFGFATGFFMGSFFNPWWGPYRGWGWHDNVNININNQNIYNHWDKNQIQNAKDKWNDRNKPMPTREGQNKFDPYSAREKAGDRMAQDSKMSDRMADRGQTADRSKIQGARPENRAAGAYDFYASKDGNVYQHRGDSGWSKNTSQGWQNVDRDRDFQNSRSNFDSQRSARDRGDQRFNSNFDRGGDFSRGGGGGFSRGGGGGGGFSRGGGGGGRRR